MKNSIFRAFWKKNSLKLCLTVAMGVSRWLSQVVAAMADLAEAKLAKKFEYL